MDAERNVGYGAGHNLLAARHDASALLFLNPDTRFVEPRTVERLLAALGGDVHAVGPKLVSANGEWDPRDHGELHGFRARVAQAAGSSHYRRRDAPADAAWVSGAACLVLRSAFDAVGGFDPGFFLYKEEEDLFLRIRRAGGRVLYLPSVRVRHDEAAVASRDDAHARLGRPLRRQAHPLAAAAARDAARPPHRRRLGRAVRPPAGPLILLLHNRYRTPGGEERAVEDLAWLIRTELGEPAAVLERDSAVAGPSPGGGRAARRRAAAGGDRRRGPALRRAGRARPQRPPGVRLAGAGRGAGGGRPGRAAPAQLPARVRDRHLLHARRGLHALPRPQHAAGGAAELPRLARRVGCVYGAALALWQRRLGECADAFVVPSEFALGRLRELGAPLGDRARVIPSVQRAFADAFGGGRGPVRAGRRPADAREGVRRRDRGVRARPACRWSSRATGRSATSCSALGGDVRFTGHVTPPSWRRSAATPRWRSCPRATRRSCRSPRSRRWRPACRSSPRAPAGWRRRCPKRACTRRATSMRSPSGCGRCTATPPPASAPSRLARERYAPAGGRGATPRRVRGLELRHAQVASGAAQVEHQRRPLDDAGHGRPTGGL